MHFGLQILQNNFEKSYKHNIVGKLWLNYSSWLKHIQMYWTLQKNCKYRRL